MLREETRELTSYSLIELIRGEGFKAVILLVVDCPAIFRINRVSTILGTQTIIVNTFFFWVLSRTDGPGTIYSDSMFDELLKVNRITLRRTVVGITLLCLGGALVGRVDQRIMLFRQED